MRVCKFLVKLASISSILLTRCSRLSCPVDFELQISLVFSFIHLLKNAAIFVLTWNTRYFAFPYRLEIGKVCLRFDTSNTVARYQRCTACAFCDKTRNFVSHEYVSSEECQSSWTDSVARAWVVYSGGSLIATYDCCHCSCFIISKVGGKNCSICIWIPKTLLGVTVR